MATGCASLRNLRLALGPSLGSLCLGSAILTLVGLVRGVRVCLLGMCMWGWGGGTGAGLQLNFESHMGGLFVVMSHMVTGAEVLVVWSFTVLVSGFCLLFLLLVVGWRL